MKIFTVEVMNENSGKFVYIEVPFDGKKSLQQTERDNICNGNHW